MKTKPKPKVSRRKEIKVGAEIIEIVNRKTIEKDQTKSWFFKKSIKLINFQQD